MRNDSVLGIEELIAGGITFALVILSSSSCEVIN